MNDEVVDIETIEYKIMIEINDLRFFNMLTINHKPQTPNKL